MADRERPNGANPWDAPRIAYDFDAEWDVEQELFARAEPRREEAKAQSKIPPEHRSQERVKRNTTPHALPNDAPRRPQRPQSVGYTRKRRKHNLRGWTFLSALALAALLIVSGMIYLVVGIFTPSEEPTEPPTELQMPTEPTVPPEEVIADLIARGDLLAQMYDYDAACDVLREFGADWQSQPDLSEAYARYQEAKAQCVRWADTTQVTHIFFHSLIADPARAFDSDYTKNGYNQYMATVDEFRAILEELYRRDFVLVRIHDIAKQVTNASGETVFEQGDIYLPPGKQPIVISQDDVNYYEYMVDSDGDRLPDAGGDGFANKLVIGSDGHPTCEYITADGETVYGEYDIVPILESFVNEHPDFSYRGAKAIMAVTGYEGVFGYHTHPEWKEILGAAAYQQEVNAAKELTQCLKDHGYEIASHSFGHPAYGELTAEEVLRDVQKWEDQVQPVVGDTDIFIYPYGSDIAGIGAYSGGKFDAMYDAGYRFFCNVDSTQYWVQIRDKYVRQGRRNIDGYRMWWDPELLDDLFDVDEIFDPTRPTPVPSIV